MGDKFCCVSVALDNNPEEVAENIRKISPNDIRIDCVHKIAEGSRASGLILIKCREESFEQIRNLPGVIELEPEIPDDNAVIRFEGGVPNV